jgi:Putative adhesin
MDEQTDDTDYASFNANPTTPLGGAEQQIGRDTAQAAREAGGPEIPAGAGTSARRGSAPEGMPPAPERHAYPPAPGYSPYPYAGPQAYGGDRGYPAGPRERRRISAWVPLAGGCLIALAALMALCAAGAGVLAAVSIGSTPASDTITKSFAVSGTPAVIVRSDAGSVHVVTGAGGAVVVTLDREVRSISRDAARRSLESIQLTTSQDGDTVNVSLHMSELSGFPDFRRRVELTVTVPAAANIDANLGAGNLDITGVSGTLTSDVGAGNLHLSDLILKGTATVSVSAGDLTVDHVSGALAARVDFGHLTLNDVSLADTSTLRMSAGDIEVSGTLPSGASLDIVDHTGNVTLALPRETSARLDATSNAGNVTVDPAWPVAVSRAASNASATGNLGTNPTGSVTIHVDAGNITLDAR